MRIKSVTLYSGDKTKDWVWNITAKIMENGSFQSKGSIIIRDETKNRKRALMWGNNHKELAVIKTTIKNINRVLIKFIISSGRKNILKK